jgi:Post-segregation antitoxin CcdA
VKGRFKRRIRAPGTRFFSHGGGRTGVEVIEEMRAVVRGEHPPPMLQQIPQWTRRRQRTEVLHTLAKHGAMTHRELCLRSSLGPIDVWRAIWDLQRERRVRFISRRGKEDLVLACSLADALQARRSAAFQRYLWRVRNRPAIEAYNRLVEQHGLLLEKYQLF